MKGLALKIFRRAVKADPEITIDKWADKYRHLPSVSSAEPGKYRTSRIPYLREIMEVLSPTSPVKQVKVIKATQLGLTEVGNNFIFCIIDAYPGSILMVMPTDSMADKHSKQKIAPSLEIMPKLHGKVKSPKSRSSGNTIRVKEFDGGILVMAGSNSTNTYRSFSARYIIGDDVDGFEIAVGDEGSPIDLLKKRGDAFPNHKIYINSTPTVKGGSNIEKEYDDSDQRLYFVPCPYCDHEQPLEWSNMKFKHKDYELVEGSVCYECESCREEIREFHKVKMLENGKWVAQNPGHAHAGFKISSLYSPIGFLSWAEIVKEFLKAQKELKFNRDNSAMIVWTNTRLAETWEDSESTTTTPEALHKSRTNYLNDGKLPDKILLLTAGVDCQIDRLEYEIKGWATDEENFGVESGVIYGAIDDKQTWKDLDEKLLERWETVSGIKLGIASACIDSGYRSDMVYKYVKGKGTSRRIHAIKGSSTPGKPLISRPTRDKKNKILLYSIGTDTAKELIFTRLKFKEPGAGYFHFPMSYDLEYFEQLTAERLIKKFVRGYPVRSWRKIRARNEILDITVYNFAALEILNPNWKKLSEGREAMAAEDVVEDEQKKETVKKVNRKASHKRPKKSGWAKRY